MNVVPISGQAVVRVLWEQEWPEWAALHIPRGMRVAKAPEDFYSSDAAMSDGGTVLAVVEQSSDTAIPVGSHVLFRAGFDSWDAPVPVDWGPHDHEIKVAEYGHMGELFDTFTRNVPTLLRYAVVQQDIMTLYVGGDER